MYLRSFDIFDYSESNQLFVVAALKEATEAFLLRPLTPASQSQTISLSLLIVVKRRFGLLVKQPVCLSSRN